MTQRSKSATKAGNVPETRRVGRRLQREKQDVKRFWLAAVIGMLVIVSALGYGVYSEFVGPARQVVVKVNDVSYPLGYLVKLLRSYQYGTEGSLDFSQLPFQVVNLIMENELVKQFAGTVNVIVTDQEVSEEVRKRIMGTPAAGDTTSRDQLDREFKEQYSRYLSGTRLSESGHRGLVRGSLLRERVLGKVSTEVPSVAPQYHLYSIALDTEQLAKEAKTEFDRGMAFKNLISKYSKDSEVVRKEGEIGWFPIGLISQLDEVAAPLELNKLSDIISQQNTQAVPGKLGSIQYIMYMVTERVDARPLEDVHRDAFKAQALSKWVAEQRAKSLVDTHFGSDQYSWVVKQVQKSAPKKQQNPQG